MNGKDGTDVPVARFPRRAELQEDIDQPRMPIIGMENIRPKINGRQERQDGPAEESKALRVVIVPVAAVPGEIFFIVDEVPRDAALFQLFYPQVLLSPGHGNLHPADDFHLLPVRRRDAGIFRQDDPDINAFIPQRLGQRTGHVGQSASLDEGDRFRRHKQNL